MLYPEMFGEVLAFHERETSWVGARSPVPVRVSAVGEVWALLAKLSVALADPVLCGLNVTVNGTLWPAGIVAGKLRPLKRNVDLLVLADVTVTLAPLAVKLHDADPLVPTTTLPRARVVGETESVPLVTVPVPDSGTVRVGFEALDAIVILPFTVPAAVGVNFAL